MMLRAMRFTQRQDLERQHDASECLQTILEIIPAMNFLCHQIQEEIKCTGCEYKKNSNTFMTITSIEIPKKRNSDGTDKFCTKDAIQNYFQSTEHNILLNCDHCPARTCSKKIRLVSPPNFIVIQFKRFNVTTLRTRRITMKNNSQSKSFMNVNINTLSGAAKYEVIATLEHIGTSMNHGHYVSYSN